MNQRTLFALLACVVGLLSSAIAEPAPEEISSYLTSGRCEEARRSIERLDRQWPAMVDALGGRLSAQALRERYLNTLEALLEVMGDRQVCVDAVRLLRRCVDKIRF